MNVKSVEKKEKNTADVTVEVSPAKFDAACDAAYRKEKGRIAIPGFRKGKAPRKIIENMYGASVFYESAIDELCPDALEYAVNEEKLDIVGRPRVKDVDIADDKTVTITFSVALYPEVKMGEYKGLSAPREAVEVSDKEIDGEIENIRKRNARIKEVSRKANKGDTANIDFEGFTDGKAFEGGKGENYDLVLGSGSFIPGFEEQVIGMKAGEEKDINVTFPEQYQKDLAGKPAVFKVKVNSVKESILPDLDDEFAKDVSEFDTLAEYRNSVKEQIAERKNAAAENAYREAIMDKLTEVTEAEIPDAMIDERVEYIIRDYENNLKAQGMDLDTYFGMTGLNRGSFESTVRPSAEKNIRFELAIEKIAELEKVEVTDEDCENELKSMAEKYNMELEAIKKYVRLDDVRAQLKRQKVEELIMDAAKAEKAAKKTSKPKEPVASEDKPKTKAKASEEAPKAKPKSAPKKKADDGEAKAADAEKPKSAPKKKAAEDKQKPKTKAAAGEASKPKTKSAPKKKTDAE